MQQIGEKIMPKESRAPVVSIYNMWGVNSDASEKSHKVRFRDDKSADGWATAFIPKCDAVVVENQSKWNMFKLTVNDENLKVRIRRKTDYSFTESEVLIRQPLDSDQPGFKELYEHSRALAKADKEKQRGKSVSLFGADAFSGFRFHDFDDNYDDDDIFTI